LFEHDQVDVDSMIIGPSGALEGVRYEDDRPRVRWFDPSLAELQAQIDRTFAGRTNEIINRSRDGNRVLIFSAGASDAGTYYVFDRNARRMETFASPYDVLQALPHAEVRPVRYAARDGLAIHGYLTLPRGRGEKGLPLVLLPHGGPFVRDKWVFDPEVQFLASRGYAVLQANFRGSTGYGRPFVEKGFGQLGAGMIDDLEDGVDWLAGQGIADPKRVCVMGSSYGGYAAMWAAIRKPERYRCAISWAGPTDLRAMLRHSERGFAARRYFRQFRNQIVGEPEVDLAAISPVRHAQRLRVPLLIAHGKDDAVVPPEQGERMIRALKAARVPNVEPVLYPKSGHDFDDADEREDFLKRVEAFLLRHNPPGAAPAQSAGVPNPKTSR
jgi:dipeptidyl aminopeptidase/acylaminoacyl peptidase